MSSTTTTAAMAAISQPTLAATPKAALLGVIRIIQSLLRPAPTLPALPAPLFPKPWQNVLVVLKPGDPEYGIRVAQFGTVTFVCDTFFHVLLNGRKEETVVTETGQAQWDKNDESGTLPMWFFTRQLGADCTDEPQQLQAKNYDLILHSGEHVRTCFFKVNRFLEITGKRRYIALADVARLRPSA